jgi:NADH-quinone oxidoreductase subunit C
MQDLAQIIEAIRKAVPNARVELIQNGSPSAQHSLLLDNKHAFQIARFLRDDPSLRFDYASSVTGVDWPEAKIKQTTKAKEIIDGQERLIERTTETIRPGFLEVVYHLYSTELKHGPLVLRLRTANREKGVHVPSFTPVWRGAEFQEREVYDLYGVVFDGHPDLRRILMWDGFKDHPMRKDYVRPDDFEYEPTPHDDVLERAKEHHE